MLCYNRLTIIGAAATAPQRFTGRTNEPCLIFYLHAPAFRSGPILYIKVSIFDPKLIVYWERRLQRDVQLMLSGPITIYPGRGGRLRFGMIAREMSQLVPKVDVHEEPVEEVPPEELVTEEEEE